MIAIGSLIQATCLWGYRELVHLLGGDPNEYLARFGIHRDADRHEGGFVSFDAYVSMLEVSAHELGCPDFGLRLAQWHGVDVLGPVSVIVRNSKTVLDAIDAAARYLFVHSPAMVLARAPREHDTDVAFTFDLRDPAVPDVIQGYEVAMAVTVRILHLVGGPDAAPTSIAFRHTQQGTDAAYRDGLGCPVQFGQDGCGFALSADIAERSVAGADTATRRMARRYLDARYIPPTAPLSERVADLARSLLPTGQCTIDAIATELALHPRTLQRQLAAEGVRCQDIIERERRTLAGRYLANPDMELSHVARLLGYTEQSALNRSCRRWFGQTPRQYRAAAAG